jgi:hypothetical protein
MLAIDGLNNADGIQDEQSIEIQDRRLIEMCFGQILNFAKLPGSHISGNSC